MGAQTDTACVNGTFTDEELYESFSVTVDERAYDCGHAGYTGTMAESNGKFYIFKEVFNSAELALKYVEDNVGCHEDDGSFLSMFSTKNYTNCARYTTKDGEKGAVYGGNYSY